MGKIKELLNPEQDSEEYWRFQIENLDASTARARRRAVQDQILQTKAELGLLIAGSVQYELDRLPGTGGIELIASVAGVPVKEAWRLLSGSYQPSDAVWARIQQLLMLCQASQAAGKVLAAQKLFRQLSDLHTEQDLLYRCVERLDRRRRGTTHDNGRHSARSAETTPAAARREPAVSPLETAAKATGAPSEPGLDAPDAPLAPPAIPDLPDARLPETLKPLRPDPMTAPTKAMFADAMRAYRIWAGNPSYREMERRCAKKISYSTFRNMLNGSTIPAKLGHVETFVRVLGGTSEDLQRWASAWRRLAMVADTADAESTGKDVVNLSRAG